MVTAGTEKLAPQPLRVDQWLWAARFFKTRSLAQQAIRGGKVDINGHRCKPAHTRNGSRQALLAPNGASRICLPACAVRPGDRLKITRGQETFEIDVLALSAKRGPASVAQTLYRETPESVAAREQRAEQRRLERIAQTRPSRRPDKRQRRQLKKIGFSR